VRDERTLTSFDTYFEDFAVGQVMRHVRGKTVTDLEAVLLCHLVSNTAEAHFNQHAMAGQPLRRAVVFGGVTAALVIGLASQDASDNVERELGIEQLRLPAPTFQGDTLYALTEVLERTECSSDRSVGRIKFKHWGVNERNEVVLVAIRSALVRRRKAATT
jgi:itaconyl-CoA hydratase